MSVKIYTVSEVTYEIRDILEGNFYGLWVKGEISGLTKSSTGHVYFDLVDDNATLGCVIFKNKLSSLKVKIKNGKEVTAYGSISLYVKGGKYSLKVEHIQETGIGKKFFDLEKLKKEFKEKGYFDRKKPIPKYPQKILVLTSPTGAAIRDITKIINRRSFGMEILILPISVQGDTAKESIINGLKMTNVIEENIDVVVLARGGGSSEDLWIFNDPDVAKALFEVKFPTISAIGHEIDIMLCDLVADKRAETPSAAAEILTKPTENLIEQIQLYGEILSRSINRIINSKSQKLKLYSTRNMHLRLTGFIDNKSIYLDRLADSILSNARESLSKKERGIFILKDKIRANSPQTKLGLFKQRVNHIRKNMDTSINTIVKRKISQLDLAKAKIEYLSPLSILNKGYSITLDRNNKPIKDSSSVKIGEPIKTLLKSGELISKVTHVNKKRG